ncbi:MAG: delta-60 repeat domain-containing protein, partial [Limisphaerales bacterium]
VSGALLNWNPGADGVGIYALAASRYYFFVGGDSLFFNGDGRELTAFPANSSVTTAWNPGASGGPVDQFALGADGTLFVAGEFTSIAGENRPYLAAFDRSGPPDFDIPNKSTPPVFTLTGNPRQNYIIEASPDFTSWTPVVTNVGRFSFSVTNLSSSLYYRSRSP